MRRTLTVLATLAMLTACGDDGDTTQMDTSSVDPGPAWFDQWDDIERFEEHEGQQVGIAPGTIYVHDCDLARRLNAPGAPFGPSERDPNTGEFEPGYAYVCQE